MARAVSSSGMRSCSLTAAQPLILRPFPTFPPCCCSLVAANVRGWPFVFMVILQPVRKGSELLYEYGAAYCKCRCGSIQWMYGYVGVGAHNQNMGVGLVQGCCSRCAREANCCVSMAQHTASTGVGQHTESAGAGLYIASTGLRHYLLKSAGMGQHACQCRHGKSYCKLLLPRPTTHMLRRA